MRTDKDQFLSKVGKIIDDANGKGMMLIAFNNSIYYIEATYFSYEDMQRFMHLLSRTPCEWYVCPATSIEKGVQLKIRLF